MEYIHKEKLFQMPVDKGAQYHKRRHEDEPLRMPGRQAEQSCAAAAAEKQSPGRFFFFILRMCEKSPDSHGYDHDLGITVIAQGGRICIFDIIYRLKLQNTDLKSGRRQIDQDLCKDRQGACQRVPEYAERFLDPDQQHHEEDQDRIVFTGNCCPEE